MSFLLMVNPAWAEAVLDLEWKVLELQHRLGSVH